MNIQDPAVWGLVALAATFGFIVGRLSKPSTQLSVFEAQLIKQMRTLHSTYKGEQFQVELAELFKAFQKLCP